MFSGIIEDLGKVEDVKTNETGGTITLSSDLFTDQIKLGDSISTNGVCLTVSKIRQGENGLLLEFGLLAETLNRTNLGNLKVNDKVNVERALKIGDRLNGHFVSGHVDTQVTLKEIHPVGAGKDFVFEYNGQYQKFFPEKGSVTLNGVGLTIGKSNPPLLLVHLVEYSLNHTNFSDLKIGDEVNLEVDYLAKYINEFLDVRT